MWKKCLEVICCLPVFLLTVHPVVYAGEEEISQKLQSAVNEHADYTLPRVTITPDLPFYLIKRVQERVVLALKRKTKEKVAYELEMAEGRLAEAKAMIEKEKYVLANRAFASFEERIESVEKQLKKGALEPPVALSVREQTERTLYKYYAVLESLETESALEENVRRKKELQKIKNRRQDGVRAKLRSLVSVTITSDDYEPPFASPVPLNTTP